MNIVIAGAGAGKTSSIAKQVVTRYHTVKNKKIIYVMTYTNSARDIIRKKIKELLSTIPPNIIIETSHVFMLHEIIYPYNRILYNEHYIKMSTLDLPSNIQYANKKISELKDKNIIHSSKVSRCARSVLCGKSNDRKKVKLQRDDIWWSIKNYFDSIFIDEAQDIDQHLTYILKEFYKHNIELFITGDPKQDLRSNNQLRKLSEEFSQTTLYLEENHRCPKNHILLSNTYIPIEERQLNKSGIDGDILIYYESDNNLDILLNQTKWDYIYIHQKNIIFNTQPLNIYNNMDNLMFEFRKVLEQLYEDDITIDKLAYRLTKDVNTFFKNEAPSYIISKITHTLKIKLTKQEYARLISAINDYRKKSSNEGYTVNSIDKIKGLEGERCLFILTNSIADYFFKKKSTQNKMMNYLYVALTRSKNILGILITKEVEENYNRVWIDEFLQQELI